MSRKFLVCAYQSVTRCNHVCLVGLIDRFTGRSRKRRASSIPSSQAGSSSSFQSERNASLSIATSFILSFQLSVLILGKVQPHTPSAHLNSVFNCLYIFQLHPCAAATCEFDYLFRCCKCQRLARRRL